MDDNKSKALAAALTQIERQFGKGSIMKLGGDNPVAEIEATSTGSLGLDIALGIGGLPKGRIIEIYGPESSGKTTLSLHVVAEEQKKGGVCAFVDAEHALDPLYARRLGVNLEELLISQPDTGEQALEIVDTLVRSGAVSVIVVDSVAALTPKSEIEGDMGDAQVGAQARLMSQAMRKLTASIGRSNCMVIFINQIRMKIGVMFGSPETTTGGNALKFYASVRIDIRRIGGIKKGDEVVGNETRVKIVKNKVSPPFREAVFDILYGEGISREGEIIELGVNHKLIEKADEDINLEGMGTTLVAATVIDHTLYFINVGDSRLYLLNKDIRQLSRDHSLVEEMVRLGGIKPEEAKHHPDKNIITRAIGAKADVEVDFYEHRLKRGDIILMCTDGLSNMVEDEELFHIVQGGRDIVESGQALIEAAKENGGTDNIGVVLIEPFADEVSVL